MGSQSHEVPLNIVHGELVILLSGESILCVGVFFILALDSGGLQTDKKLIGVRDGISRGWHEVSLVPDNLL